MKNELPANIRQIGTIDGSSPRIYIEDFVCTYLRQIAETGGRCEVLAYLVGRSAEVDGAQTVFIDGAVQGKYSVYADGMEQFTDKSRKYAEEMLSLYFPEREVVGWMQTQPGYGCGLNPAYADAHMNHFTGPNQVLFVMDPQERQSAFYAWNDGQSAINERGGYFIYYDKNDGMREYMLDNKLSPKLLARPSRSAVGGPARPPESAPGPEDAPATPPRRGAPRPTAAGRGADDVRKMTNMLVSLGAVLFIICFIMGAGLIQGDTRLSKLEGEVASLDATYSFLAAQARNQTEAVFANTGEGAARAAEAAGSELVITDAAAGGDAIAEYAPAAVITPPPTVTPLPTLPPQQAPQAIAAPAPAEAPSQAPPQAAPGAAANVIYDTYTVEPGDSLLSISRKFYGTPDRVADIMRLNDIAEADMIYFGKQIKLPPK